MPPAVVARVLGYGIRCNDRGRDALVRDILACNKEAELLAGVAHLYVYGLCRVFYNPKGPTPRVSPSLTPRLSLEVTAKESFLLLDSSRDASRLRTETLLCDNHRCIFTGLLDETEAELEFTKTKRLQDYAFTNVAHIISQSLSENISGVHAAAHAKFEWARTGGAMLQRFGGFDAHEVLCDEILQSPKNAFTASMTAHAPFDALKI
ncbi:hypothetical protein FOMPIDRAFT_88923 [Fomitopsis schrenkii]|uniref:HNH nuclease domain-containing protein n=1 Tax=Fomitopsis schrenkii TaxID=2126942 RepID=S8DZ05_FOMSC|nr:hypothetical protein FOMPIDRAFT_88923 [Fomitopsis schrenkii]